MNTEEFMSLPMNDKVRTVNKMLEKEEKDHLKMVSEKIGIPYSAFTKLMRDNGNYQYNQTTKKYEKLISLEEYEKYLDSVEKLDESDKPNETLRFLEKHLDELKRLLHDHQGQLIIDPIVYNPSSKTINKSFQVNADIYNQFSKLCTRQFPHLRQRDIISMSLLEFIRSYQRDPSE
ncbi:hypothetical protein [Virgibacillus sp. SK37]|uniref:hypothetical protein n=1 Tax=Virgibacillus sp. SK37 TaxID=403957 RepID=UPI0004D0DECD|nr:hypothetical protein [Virgibacillus sp. SK37]AIF45125.1 hypothetical protein X953_01725 [Virgibacillus sp. SK37]